MHEREWNLLFGDEGLMLGGIIIDTDADDHQTFRPILLVQPRQSRK